MKALLALLITITWASLWLTPDQEGMWYFNRGDFVSAAKVFLDPEWQGASWYKAGEFQKAAQAYSRRDTAEANYNQGNALLMHGKYKDAIASYDKALEKHPGWKEAMENRGIAAARAKTLDIESGNMTEGMLGADEIVFDKKAGKDAASEDVEGGEAVSNQDIQALWLRRVQTRPADFLKAKFAFQQKFEMDGGKK
ncbi:tetratricopeptide repeat protein [Desulfopila aestuarii]|uniref:Ca-activated chloride channel family protein n=1 Tax=Desulfopila aestuarii DSM 18488 TaxID=1121416 RepID=A0A1M7YF61_9BACT|nr:tetratricopeptide repeat protein [Desulfopila aestuarii]SHO51209.1 Ca-activated chloride channel family protein [Desulfopila aestuarii DSM 18488]